MQSIFQSEETRKFAPAGNYDFSINRCKAEKLAEQMSVEKAMAILKIPSTRSVNVTDRRLIDESFKKVLQQRVKISPIDPDYERKIENRHVLDVLIHEAYQFMIKHSKWKDSDEDSGYKESNPSNEKKSKRAVKMENEEDKAKIQLEIEQRALQEMPAIFRNISLDPESISVQKTKSVLAEATIMRSKFMSRVIETYLQSEDDEDLESTRTKRHAKSYLEGVAI